MNAEFSTRGCKENRNILGLFGKKIKHIWMNMSGKNSLYIVLLLMVILNMALRMAYLVVRLSVGMYLAVLSVDHVLYIIFISLLV